MRTRFAPSPTGPLHLGHAYAAIVAHDMARDAGGEFLLRIEDIDQSRARDEWEALIYTDLAWLGLHWEQPVMRQSERLDAYQEALTTLWDKGLLFACTCTRRDIEAAASAPQEGVPTHGPDGRIYPGTCRHRSKSPDLPHPPKDAALRLNMETAVTRLPDLSYEETGLAPATYRIDVPNTVAQIGDVVLARRDMGTSYHLSVVVDDAAQGITHVTRGKDLADATAVHVILQALLGLPTPIYHHHRLIRDEHGKRLAKRDDSRALRLFREARETPDDIRRRVGL